jgi:hypothetical protein
VLKLHDEVGRIILRNNIQVKRGKLSAIYYSKGTYYRALFPNYLITLNLLLLFLLQMGLEGGGYIKIHHRP